MFAFNDSLTAFHSPALSGMSLGPRRLAGSSATLSAGKPERSVSSGGHPVNPDAAFFEQEGQPVDRRMDHDLAWLVEEFI